ncbi:calcium-binding and coiled-coil domain-containing protein 2 [Xyrauchen texanus]|uniref:calcium-binding and coiled-coil domain-containing protein 2 n=1 Tax=Xyrauchen texanus TaxID=154827 RepID=UPI0022421D02|nr:calcium-binding and coiled-coil domain-containing protein 2 [Xyrauchen texanus]XP_051968621.1 calcium-binding and coiled-coil domain-containing protein 2 [Xyrauchen texanus]
MNDRTEEEMITAVMETSSFSQVVFNDVPPSYPPNTAVTCRYTLTGGLQPNPRDWIGIFKVGWNSTTMYLCYVWVEPCLDHVGFEPVLQHVVFKESNLLKDDGEFYQFCYVDSSGRVKGASTPFCFQKAEETSLDCSLEKDILVVTTQEQAEKMEKEKEEYVKEINSLKELNEILRKELDERLHEICCLRISLDDLKIKDKLETPLSDVQNYNSTEEVNKEQPLSNLPSLSNLQEKYEKAVQKINMLKGEKAELRQKVELQEAEALKQNTVLKETEQKYYKLQDCVQLLQVDMQSSRKDNEKLHAEIQELIKVKKTLEDLRDENKGLHASISVRGGEENNKEVQIQAILTQLTEARRLLHGEMQNCKEANRRAEGAERELKEVKKELAEMAVNLAEGEKISQIQAQLHGAQDKIYEMAETSRLDRETLIEKNEKLQAEVEKLRKALFDYQLASVASISEQLPNPQSPPATANTQEQTYTTDSHYYESIDDLTGDPTGTENKMRVCQHCQESFPRISEDELAQHEQSHKVCPFCTLICDDWEQQAFEDHVYSHED